MTSNPAFGACCADDVAQEGTHMRVASHYQVFWMDGDECSALLAAVV